MSDYITASFDTLLEQAPTTAAVYLRAAKREIDSVFGEGYAAKNPALVAAFIQAAASDMNTATNSKVMGAALLQVSSALSEVATALESQNK
jgi:hypothetical protein